MRPVYSDTGSATVWWVSLSLLLWFLTLAVAMTAAAPSTGTVPPPPPTSPHSPPRTGPPTAPMACGQARITAEANDASSSPATSPDTSSTWWSRSPRPSSTTRCTHGPAQARFTKPTHPRDDPSRVDERRSAVRDLQSTRADLRPINPPDEWVLGVRATRAAGHHTRRTSESSPLGRPLHRKRQSLRKTERRNNPHRSG